MKLNFILVSFLALVFSSLIPSAGVAVADESLSLDNELQSATSMTWPMLPGENIDDIARLFYPKNQAMQRQFVFKTLRLNASTQPKLNAKNRYKTPTLLVIPTLKSLSSSTRAIQSGEAKSSKQKLHLSYNLQQAIEEIPAKMIQDYDVLVSKNEFLKQQLTKLNEKIVFLQTKLADLKLILDKTLNLPANSIPVDDSANIAVNSASTSVSTNVVENNTTNNVPINAPVNPPSKKVFKNLNADAALAKNKTPMAIKIEVPQEPGSLLDYLNTDLVKAASLLGLLAVLCTYLLKKYRERMLSKFSFVATKVQATVSDFGGYLQPKKAEVAPEITPEAKQEAQAAKEVEARLDATLEEARLLISINRHQDAIAHLKLTIESQPKASINHWLYLLEIFRKLNLKDEFEAYAKDLHDTFNVMTPIWYETKIAMVVPQSLEEFPHIMEKLYSVWPGDLATVYLRGLITDNRGGERTGFGKEVLSEILMLIALQDTRKDFT